MQEKYTPESAEDGPKPKNYVSWFQSVTTIGVMTTSTDEDEAIILAQEKMMNGVSGGMIGGIWSQTPYTLIDTEECDLNKPVRCENSMKISLDSSLLSLIATNLKKDPSSLNADDCLRFIRNSVSSAPISPNLA